MVEGSNCHAERVNSEQDVCTEAHKKEPYAGGSSAQSPIFFASNLPRNRTMRDVECTRGVFSKGVCHRLAATKYDLAYALQMQI